jgi:hypothetical protein
MLALGCGKYGSPRRTPARRPPPPAVPSPSVSEETLAPDADFQEDPQEQEEESP